MTEIPVRMGSRGTSRTVGLSGEPATGACDGSEHGRPTVERFSHPVPDPAQPPLPDGDLERPAFETDRHRGGIDPGRALQDLHHRHVAVDLEHERAAQLARGQTHVRELVPADTLDASHDEQRAFGFERAVVLDAESGADRAPEWS